MLFAGDKCPANIKFKDHQIIHRTLVLVTCNNDSLLSMYKYGVIIEKLLIYKIKSFKNYISFSTIALI